jgi:5S rRNA maturation endonuclease (ribonuclease M5)
MGLADVSLDRTVIYDLDNNGIESNATTNKVYEDAYESFLNEKNKYAKMYHQLAVEIEQNKKPLIIIEGKTDAKHLKAALSRLGITDISVDFFDTSDLHWGDSQLKSMLDHLCKVKQTRRIIGIFDRDSEEYIKYASGDGNMYKDLGNNVYAFAIPLVNKSEYGDKISIEHYYSRKDIKLLDENGRRLFLGDEFYTSGNSKDGRYQTKTSKIQNKVAVNGIIDEKVYESTDLEQKNSVALTKDSFAEDILNNVGYTRNIDFTNFNEIFDIIRQIINK